jgi:hypothetical protein
VISALLALTLAACPAKVPAWGAADDAPVPRAGEVLQVVSDSKCRLYLLTRNPSALVRLDASGAPSPEFASNGVLALEQHPDGLVLDEAHERVIVYGSINGAASTQVELRAWNLDGVPKRAFGKAGVARLEGRRLSPTQASAAGTATAVVFDDGALLVVLQVASPVKDESAVYASRLSVDGALERGPSAPSFTLAGMAGGGPHLTRVGVRGAWYFTSTGKEGLLARFDAQARLDADVGEAGVAHCGAIAYANALLTDGDGVLLGGTGTGYKQVLERRTARGALDRSFGTGGQIFFKADPARFEHIRALLRTTDGVLALFASYDHLKQVSRTGLESWAFDGRLDTNVASGGVRWFSYDAKVTDGTALTTDDAGRIFIALNAGDSLIDSKMRAHLVRVEPAAALAPQRAVAPKRPRPRKCPKRFGNIPTRWGSRTTSTRTTRCRGRSAPRRAAFAEPALLAQFPPLFSRQLWWNLGHAHPADHLVGLCWRDPAVSFEVDLEAHWLRDLRQGRVHEPRRVDQRSRGQGHDRRGRSQGAAQARRHHRRGHRGQHRHRPGAARRRARQQGHRHHS